MRLQSLCDVPLLKILRYLNVQSLIELSISSSTFYHYIRRNRSQLVETRIARMTLVWLKEQTEQNFEEWCYEARLSRRNSSDDSVENDENTIVISKVTRKPASDNTDVTYLTFAQWFSKIFRNTVFGHVHFEMLEFDYDTILEWTQMIRVNKIRAEFFELEDHIRNEQETNAWIVFCKTLQIRRLEMWEQLEVPMYNIWTDEFIEFIPTLTDVMLKSNAILMKVNPAVSTLKGSVYKFPPVFNTAYCMETSIESVAKGVQLWFDDKIAIDCWTFLMSDQIWKPEELATIFGVPFEINSDEGAILTNRNQRKVSLSTYKAIPEYLVVIYPYIWVVISEYD